MFAIARDAMTQPRPVFPGTSLVTRRCSQRMMLLRPDDKINEAVMYCLGVATQRYGIGILAFTAMSNHLHDVLDDPLGRLPDFSRDFHSLLARVGNCLRGRWENFWDNAQASHVRLLELGDVFEKCVYVLANPVVDHLVDTAVNWPGVTSAHWLDGRSVTVKRPVAFSDADRSVLPDEVTFKLVAPRDWKGTFDEWAAKLNAAVAAKEADAACERSFTGDRVLGRKAVMATSPQSRPKTKEPRRGRIPTIACRNKALRIATLEALKAFRRWHRNALLLFRDGWRQAPFPPGTWFMAKRFGALVAPS